MLASQEEQNVTNFSFILQCNLTNSTLRVPNEKLNLLKVPKYDNTCKRPGTLNVGRVSETLTRGIVF